jgi:hypothetical protein
MKCERIKPLFEIIESLFTAEGEIFSNTVLIWGFQYSKQQKIKYFKCKVLFWDQLRFFLSRK